MMPYGDITSGNDIFNFIRLDSMRPTRYTRSTLFSSKSKRWDKAITILISVMEVTGSVHGQDTVYDSGFPSSTYIIKLTSEVLQR